MNFYKFSPKAIVFTLSILIGIGLIVGSVFVLRWKSNNPTPITQEESGDVLSQLASIRDTGKDPNSPYNIVIVGYGGPGHDGGSLADTIIILHIDPKLRKSALVSVPRDAWVALPYDWENLANFKINAAYAIGGDDQKYANKKPEFRGEKGAGEMIKYAADLVTGLHMDYFLAVDFSNFSKIIDIMGGLEVDVPVAFEDKYYPIKGLENETCGKSAEEIARLHSLFSDSSLHKQFTCRYEQLKFEKGIQKMTGETALKFVRSRNSPQHGGDFSRSERQFALLEAAKKEMFSIQILPKLDPIIGQLFDSVRTDITPEVLVQFIANNTNFKDYQMKKIQITDANVLNSSTGPGGQFILVGRQGINKWDGVHEYINNKLSE